MTWQLFNYTEFELCDYLKTFTETSGLCFGVVHYTVYAIVDPALALFGMVLLGGQNEIKIAPYFVSNINYMK